MTTHTGDEGVVKVGTDTIAEVTSFSFDVESGIINDTAKGDVWETNKAGRKRWSGTIECMWDQDDTNGQVAMVEGAEVTLNLFVEGDASGDIQYGGSAIITRVNHSSPEGESVATASFDFTGNGTLSRTTVA